MKYTVIWTPPAERDLAATWLAAPDRGAVAAAAHRIDLLLQYNPQQAGESRDNHRRIVFASPLGARFVVHEQNRRVLVLQVWRFELHSK